MSKSKKIELEKIELIFENCEHCVLPVEVVYNLVLTQFNKTITYSEWNKYSMFENCQLERLQLYKEPLKNINPYIAYVKNKEYSVYERIKRFSDITSIRLVYNDKTNKDYYVPWNDEDEYYNKYQNITEDDKFIHISIKNKQHSNLE